MAALLIRRMRDTDNACYSFIEPAGRHAYWKVTQFPTRIS
jgi:hypothetical protein